MANKSWWAPFTFWWRGGSKYLLLWLGPLCIGAAATLLSRAAGWSFDLFQRFHAAWWWWPFVSLSLGGLALTWFLRQAGPGASGSGIQQAMAAVEMVEQPQKMESLIGLRLALVKFAAIVGGLGSGFVLGLEGPTIQIGACIFYAFRRFLPETDPSRHRRLIIAGGAAGIASAFNAPMAGLIFAFEELAFTPGKGHLGKLVLAIILAGVVAEPMFGHQSYFGRVDLADGLQLNLLPLMIILALLGGLTGGAFSWLALRTAIWLPRPVRRFSARHPYYFVAACGLLIAVLGLAAPIFGSGAELTKTMLNDQVQVPWYYLPLKFGGLVLTFLTGLPGGIFSPSLSIGAGLGALFTPLVGSMWQSEFIAVGMVAVLAAVTRAPLTAAFIMIEMTDGHSMVLPALGAAFLAAWVASFFKARFYHELAERLLRAD